MFRQKELYTYLLCYNFTYKGWGGGGGKRLE